MLQIVFDCFAVDAKEELIFPYDAEEDSFTVETNATKHLAKGETVYFVQGMNDLRRE